MNIQRETGQGKGLGLRWLFVDMNSFFASCEQQANPRLRGRPVAIVPADTDTTCAIAASYEAKAFGVKTGTMVREAKRLCPQIALVPAHPKLYVACHHRFVEAIETCMPVEDVMSVDEVACRLDRTQQTREAARQLALRIKTMMREMVGEHMTCSIGVASNKLLAKLGSDMQKPDGLTILHPDDLPQAILHLAPNEICGIGPNMELRLARAGITTMHELWQADDAALRRVWGGVTGARFHALLHGMDLPSPCHPRRSMGHQHVLSPDTRTMAKALMVARQLLAKAAMRLRKENFYARRLMLDIKWTGHLGYFVDELRFRETHDTGFLLQSLTTLWLRAPELKPLRVGVTLADLVPATAHQMDLFDRPRCDHLTQAIDKLNEKYGRGTVAFGNSAAYIASKIPFSHVPDIGET
jgi:DNA polymerase-4